MNDAEKAIYKRIARLLSERSELPWWAAIRYHQITLQMRALLNSLDEPT